MKLLKCSFLILVLGLSTSAAAAPQKLILRPLPFSLDNCMNLFPYEEGLWQVLSSHEVQVKVGALNYKLKKSGNSWLHQAFADSGSRQRSFVLIFEQNGDTYIVSEKITENELEHTEQCAGQYRLVN